MTTEEQALLRGVVAVAEDDLPRLVYADWLEEHGDADRAEFIRVQCQLADLSPAEPDWVELTLRQTELVARLMPRLSELASHLPPGLRFHKEPWLGSHAYQYWLDGGLERGFAHLTGANWSRPPSTGFTRLLASWPETVAATTIRGLAVSGLTVAQMGELLRHPSAAALSDLRAWLHARTRADGVELARHVANSSAAPNLRRLEVSLTQQACGGWLAGLTTVRTFDRLTRLTLPTYTASRAALARLTAAPWFRRLRHLRLDLAYPTDGAADAVAAACRLPDLHTLELDNVWVGGRLFQSGGSFPALAWITLHGDRLETVEAADLARLDLPRIAGLELPECELNSTTAAALAAADWFPRLRCLHIPDTGIGDRGITALAKAGTGLRVVRAGQNSFGRSGVLALATLPDLAALSLNDPRPRREWAGDEIARLLAALARPGLRHLDLSHWPIGDAGAKVIASDPGFAGLTWLGLDWCDIGPDGAAALFHSPHLQRLVTLRMSHNRVGSTAAALADPAVLPALGECRVDYNVIPSAVVARLRKRRPVVWAWAGYG